MFNLKDIFNNVEMVPSKDNKNVTIRHNCNYADMQEIILPEKTGATAKEIEALYMGDDIINKNYFEKTVFEIITGISPDVFAKLYQAGIITIKENISSLAAMIEEYGIEETINIFNAKKKKE